MENKIRVCIIGSGFVGWKHAEAYSRQHDVKLQVICDINEDSAKRLAEEYGFERVEKDWRNSVSAEDVDLVCICTPNNAHFDIVLEAIKNKKYICCEKPLGINSKESIKLANLAKENEIFANCCYNIIRIPAIRYVKKIIMSGELGKIVCFSGKYDNDRLADQNACFEWRLLKKNAQGGVLSDLAINILAVSQFLVGDIISVCGMTDIIHKRRKDFNGNYLEVENSDIAQFLCKYQNGAIGHISCNRVAHGSKQDMQLEIQLTNGTIKFSLERMNEVQICKFGENGFTRVVSDGDRWFCNGYEDLRTLDAIETLKNIKNKKYSDIDFVFATKIDQVIESVLESADKKKWIDIESYF